MHMSYSWRKSGNLKWINKNVFQLPYKTAPIKASPAPVVSTSSEGGMASAVPTSILPWTLPFPGALKVTTCYFSLRLRRRVKDVRQRNRLLSTTGHIYIKNKFTVD